MNYDPTKPIIFTARPIGGDGVLTNPTWEVKDASGADIPFTKNSDLEISVGPVDVAFHVVCDGQNSLGAVVNGTLDEAPFNPVTGIEIAASQ